MKNQIFREILYLLHTTQIPAPFLYSCPSVPSSSFLSLVYSDMSKSKAVEAGSGKEIVESQTEGTLGGTFNPRPISIANDDQMFSYLKK